MAAVASESLLVETPSVESALELIEELRGLHAELSPGDGVHFLVSVELDRSKEDWLARVTAGLDRWLARGAIATARVTLDGRSYVVEAPATDGRVG